ncbi:MAG: hypothetical protein ACE5G8_13760, partial [Anaerolineae bacterium]
MHPVNCKLRLRFGQAALILLLLIPGARPAWAQFSGNIDIRFTASGDELTVGDPVTLTLAATYPAGYDIAIPSLPNSWGDFDVRRQSEPETTLDPDGVKTTRQTIEVTLFAPGTFQTPSWSVTLRGQNGETVERAVPQVSLTVLSVLQEGDADLKDIKPQAELPLPPLWPWLAGGLLLAALLAWAARWLYRRLKGRRVDVPLPAAPAADPRPPHEIALAELARIERLDLPGQGRFKEHYTLVGDCLRRYLEGRYHIPALD